LPVGQITCNEKQPSAQRCTIGRKQLLSAALFFPALFSTDRDKILQSSALLMKDYSTHQAVAASPSGAERSAKSGRLKEKFSLPASKERLQLLCSKSFQIISVDKTSD
jgi:hypothetical protein